MAPRALNRVVGGPYWTPGGPQIFSEFSQNYSFFGYPLFKGPLIFSEFSRIFTFLTPARGSSLVPWAFLEKKSKSEDTFFGYLKVKLTTAK